MVTKTQKSGGSAKSSGGAAFSGSVKESAQQIWLAGLGAFSRAQDEGGKVYEALVKEGVGLQRKTQAAAEEKISEATSRMASMASGISSKASGEWGKLGDIFEARVATAMKKLGVPSARDIEALNARIDALNSKLAQGAAGAPAKAPAKKAAVKAAAKAPVKPAAGKSAAKKAPSKTPARKAPAKSA